MQEVEKHRDIIIISNRLPVTLNKCNEGTWSFTQSSGGLVSALTDFKKNTKFIWIGWPGLEIPSGDQEHVKQRLFDDFSCVPVFLTDDLARLYYDGYSNSVIWPLFHYYTCEIPFNEKLYDGYKRANLEFANVVAQFAKDSDIIWIHDYQLMLLPQMLRQTLPYKDIGIAFFLHIPFPSSDIFRVQPTRNELLGGLLGCDLIGFHTYDYARHFISSCKHIFGMKTGFSYVELPDRLVHIGIFPIGIDPQKFKNILKLPEVKIRMEDLKDKFKKLKIAVGIDRLDYIKGLPHKLRAFECFLEMYPEWIGKIVLVQVAVPSRQNVDEYKSLKRIINEMVGRINGKFAKIDYHPIHFVYNSIDSKEMAALYSVSDVCLVTSTRDGMNLVSYEFIACQSEKKGSLIISEFAGAAQSFSGAYIVNPWNPVEVARSIYEAVTVSDEAKISNYESLNRYIHKYTASRWGMDLINEIKYIGNNNSNSYNIIPNEEICERVKSTTGRKFFFLAVDSILAPSVPKKESHFASNGASNTCEKFVQAVTALANKNSFVYILSGETKNRLEKLFPSKSIGLSAELGCFYRHPNFLDLTVHIEDQESYSFFPVYKKIHCSNKNEDINSTGKKTGAVVQPQIKTPLNEFKTIASSPSQKNCFVSRGEWISLVSESEFSWKNTIMPVFRLYARSIPQSRLEEREINVVWHSTSQDSIYRSWQASELKEVIKSATMNMFITVFIENESLILKPANIDRSVAITSIMKDHATFYGSDNPDNFIHVMHNSESSLASDKTTYSLEQKFDSNIRIRPEDICILVSDSRNDSVQFQSLFGLTPNRFKMDSLGTGQKLKNKSNVLSFIVGGKSHADAQYHFADAQSLINLLNSISNTL